MPWEPPDTMEYSSQYYTDRIAETKTRAEARAQELYNKALRGEISYTEAWYSLPGPVPNVQVINLGGMGPRPQMTYNVQYPFLSDDDASRLKAHAEREFREAMDARDSAQQVIPLDHNRKTHELKDAVEKTRSAFDSRAAGLAQRKAQVEELRANLAAYEAAYEREAQEFETAKREKERAEAAHLDYTSKASALMQVAKAETEVVLNRFAKYRDDNVARQQAETEEWLNLWKGVQSAVFNERGSKAEACVAAARRSAMDARIEQEVQRRLKDAEFEAAVAARLRALQG